VLWYRVVHYTIEWLDLGINAMDRKGHAPSRESSYIGQADNYDERRFSKDLQQIWHEHDIEIVKEFLDIENNKKILEVAAGTGRVAVNICSDGGRIICIELAEDMLRAGVKKGREVGARRCVWVRGDAFQLPFGDETFDGLYAVRFLNIFKGDQLKKVCLEFERVVKTDGILVVHFSNAFYGFGISLIRRLFGTYSKYPTWPWEIGKLFPKSRLDACRGTYLPIEGAIVKRFNRKLGVAFRRTVSMSFLKHICHTKYYRLIKRP